jgi:hypothetical protein
MYKNSVPTSQEGNTMPLGYKNQSVSVVWGNNAVRCENNTKRIRILYGQNVEFLC